MRDKLIDILYNGFHVSPKDDLNGVVQKAADYLIAHGVTVQTTSIEAEPVKHGRWEVFPAGPVAVYGCSLCRTEIPFGKFPDEMRFCPNCGADMRKEKQN